MKDIEGLKELGISSPYAVKVMPYHRDENGHIVTDYHKVSESQIAQDAALSTVPNIGVPAAYTTYLDPRITEICLRLWPRQNFTAKRRLATGPIALCSSRFLKSLAMSRRIAISRIP